MSSAVAHVVDRIRDADDRSGASHVEARALVAHMTTEEKLDCLDGDTDFWPGFEDMTAGGYYRHPWPAAVVERLGIPAIQFADGPRGAVIRRHGVPRVDGTRRPVRSGARRTHRRRHRPRVAGEWGHVHRCGLHDVRAERDPADLVR